MTKAPVFSRVGFDLDSKKSKDLWRISRLMDVAVAYKATLHINETRNGYHFKLFMPIPVTLQEDLAIRAPYDSSGRLFFEDIRRVWFEKYGKFGQHIDMLHSSKIYPNGQIGTEEKEIVAVENGIVNPNTEKHLRKVGLLKPQEEKREPRIQY
tara:strand:- start:2117 stop:2575 length:459 start_codon:yes stop_codon:yes gene_type:complete